jgi:glycine betaine/proline transport system ATP-binding protein
MAASSVDVTRTSATGPGLLTAPPVLDVRGLWKVFGSRADRVVGGPLTELTRAEPTLVRCLTRLVEPTAGEVLLDGEDILSYGTGRLRDLRRNRFGMLFRRRDRGGLMRTPRRDPRLFRA